jgi:hypothetical protein
MNPEIMEGWMNTAALEAVHLIMESPSFAGVVVEIADSATGASLIASGASLFLKEQFALDELSRPRAGLLQRILSAELAGNPVVLSQAEIAEANATVGLNAATLWARWRGDIQSSEAIHKIFLEFSTSYATLHAGYFLKRILFEIRDQNDLLHATSTGLCRILGFGQTGSAAGSAPFGLAVVELSTASPLAASVVGRHFHQRPPVLALSATDQEMLLAVLEDNLQDEELAARLAISLPAVKRRWAALYSRVEASDPSFFHRSQNEFVEERKEGARGLEKRRRIVHFVRNHPEELRPFSSQAT